MIEPLIFGALIAAFAIACLYVISFKQGLTEANRVVNLLTNEVAVLTKELEEANEDREAAVIRADDAHNDASITRDILMNREEELEDTHKLLKAATAKALLKTPVKKRRSKF